MKNKMDWRPRKGDEVLCLKTGDYFQAGQRYIVAQGRRGKMVGFYVYEPLGYRVLTTISNFEPV